MNGGVRHRGSSPGRQSTVFWYDDARTMSPDVKLSLLAWGVDVDRKPSSRISVGDVIRDASKEYPDPEKRAEYFKTCIAWGVFAKDFIPEDQLEPSAEAIAAYRASLQAASPPGGAPE